MISRPRHRVLVLTYQDDPHADAVCSYLRAKRVGVFRVNTEELGSRLSLTFRTDGPTWRITTADCAQEIDPSWSIWNRRVSDPTLPASTPPDLRRVALDETELTWEGLLQMHPGRVVNRPHNNRLASNKLLQLTTISSLNGPVQVPATLFTNEPTEAVSFFERGPRICHKLQRAPLVNNSGLKKTVYTNLVCREHLRDADLVSRHPVLFQEYIEKLYDVRVTVLEKRAIAIAIHSQDSERSRVDYRRYDFENVKYEHVEMPGNVEEFALAINRRFGLLFSQIDMVYSTSQEFHFLEVNPNGQWLWLEELSGFKLTPLVGDNLLSR